MRIAGYQPLSLIDYPGTICSVVFTQGCPFRCPYCHNPELVPHREGQASVADVLAHLDRHRRMLEGVCVTGGEPTVQPDLPHFLAEIKRRGLLVKLDTNGTHPEMVRAVLEAKLADFVAMDLKHTWARYDDVTRTGNAAIAALCRKTYDLVRTSGVAHEFRTTVSPALHSEEDIVAIATGLDPYARYALQQVRYGKMLNPDHPRGALDLSVVETRIREERPDLELSVR